MTDLDLYQLCGIKDQKDMNLKERIIDILETIWYRYILYVFIELPGYLNLYFKNISRFSTTLWRNYDWDFIFVLQLEYTKLKQLSKYFETSNIVKDEWVMAKQTKLASKLLEIILEEGGGNINEIHINIRNASRFLSPEDIDYLKRSNECIKGENYILTSLRYEKAWKLYCKLREKYMRTWWE